MLRGRIGFKAWRYVHWLAYASWPVALMHTLGTGSDARTGWLQLLWQALEVIESDVPPGAAITWVYGEPRQGGLSEEEGIPWPFA